MVAWCNLGGSGFRIGTGTLEDEETTPCKALGSKLYIYWKEIHLQKWVNKYFGIYQKIRERKKITLM